MRAGSRAAAVLVAIALLVVGCGDDSDEASSEPAPRPTEAVDPLPKLPASWSTHVNQAGGFALGLPPGWRADDRGTSTLVRSFDRLVAVSIAPDRTSEAIELPLGDFATRALTGLSGFEGELEAGPERPFEHRYRGVVVEGSGIATDTGLRQRLRLIVLRRDRQVTFSVVIAANAAPEARPSERLAERMVKTLRSRPPALTPG